VVRCRERGTIADSAAPSSFFFSILKNMNLASYLIAPRRAGRSAPGNTTVNEGSKGKGGRKKGEKRRGETGGGGRHPSSDVTISVDNILVSSPGTVARESREKSLVGGGGRGRKEGKGDKRCVLCGRPLVRTPF